ncbi:MAG: hypothetical protein ACJAWV_002296 [Flammeovirgaceae bacterium]|jgi:hypothetical protein
MEEAQRIELLEKAKSFFRKEIVGAHLNVACKKASKLSNYNVNPFLFKYLANFLRGNDDSRSIAEALVFSQIIDFEIQTDKLIDAVFSCYKSDIDGVDIEFIDQKDKRRKYCQLYLNPDKIDFESSQFISKSFGKSIRNFRERELKIALNDMIVGVFYGEQNSLSSLYLSIPERYTTIVGADFWHRLTGSDTFYPKMIDELFEILLEITKEKECQNEITQLQENFC